MALLRSLSPLGSWSGSHCSLTRVGCFVAAAFLDSLVNASESMWSKPALVILTARTRSWFGLVAHRLRYIIHIKFGLIQDMRVKEKWSPPNLYKPSNDTSKLLSKYLVWSKHTFGIEQHSPLFRDRMPGRRQCCLRRTAP